MRCQNGPLGLKATVGFAGQALRAWTLRQWRFAAGASLAFGLLIGVVTVLIPNPWFARDIEPVWWNYPVWVVTSVLTGLLLTTYLRPTLRARRAAPAPTEADDDPAEKRSARMGIAGSMLAWFAVGCPVCNKLALLALGYSGAITWFAPVQPFLALAAMVLTGAALVWRLRGQVACPVPATQARSLEAAR